MPAFARESSCGAMDVADCCAHACLTVAGGKAAACNGVFQHHTPCVGQISVRRAGQGDVHSEKVCQPSLPCPALHCTRLAEPLCARMADHPLASPFAGRHFCAFYTHKNIRVPPGADFYALSHGLLRFCCKCRRKKRMRSHCGWMRCGCPGEGSVRGVFFDLYVHFFENASLFGVL